MTSMYFYINHSRYSYHYSEIPDVNLIAPFHVQDHLRCPVNLWLNIIVMLNVTETSFPKVTQYGSSPSFWVASLSRSVDYAIAVDFPVARIFSLCIFKIRKYGLAFDFQENVGRLDI